MKTIEIIERWKRGETLAEIAQVGGISRQAVSRRLIRAGFSPRERRYAEQAANGSQASAERLDALTEQAEQREQAAARLAKIAASRGVTPRQLAASGDEGAARVCAPFSLDYLAHLVG